MTQHRFPFGAASTPRPLREPTSTSADTCVLGVYPSALHVRWTLPAWAVERGLPKRVGALAVDVEPTVFWDGISPDPDMLVRRWVDRWFRPGDEPGQHGHVVPAMNGTSGQRVAGEILAPISRRLEEAWVTDVVNTFYVKRGGSRRSQGDVIDDIYQRFADLADLPRADLPRRPTPTKLIKDASTQQKRRLEREWRQASPRLLITLGEEARRVAGALADFDEGPPTRALSATDPDYGRPGRIEISGHAAEWMALTHPGNSAASWREARRGWEEWASERFAC